jgi:hypothetical protein
MCALVVNIFDPLMIHSSPSRTARVCAPATSEPDSGSLKPSTMMISPRTARGRISRRKSSVPARKMARATITVVPLAYVGVSAP